MRDVAEGWISAGDCREDRVSVVALVNMPDDSGFAALAIAHPRFQRTPANRGVGGHVCMHIHANECVVGVLQQCAT